MMEENYKILLRIIQQILTTKTLQRFTETVQMNLILFLTIDTTLTADNPMVFRKNFYILLYKNYIN